jgi:hypothetical protein
VAVVDRWLFFRGIFYDIKIGNGKWNPEMLVVVGWWLLFGVDVSSGLNVFSSSYIHSELINTI